MQRNLDLRLCPCLLALNLCAWGKQHFIKNFGVPFLSHLVQWDLCTIPEKTKSNQSNSDGELGACSALQAPWEAAALMLYCQTGPAAAPGLPTIARGELDNISSKIKQLKATFSLTWFMRREYMSSCPIQLSFYSSSVRAWGETGLETWLSHARRIWFVAWFYIGIVFNINLWVLSNYDLWTSLGGYN